MGFLGVSRAYFMGITICLTVSFVYLIIKSHTDRTVVTLSSVMTYTVLFPLAHIRFTQRVMACHIDACIISHHFYTTLIGVLTLLFSNWHMLDLIIKGVIVGMFSSGVMIILVYFDQHTTGCVAQPSADDQMRARNESCLRVLWAYPQQTRDGNGFAERCTLCGKQGTEEDELPPPTYEQATTPTSPTTATSSTAPTITIARPAMMEISAVVEPQEQPSA